MGFYGHITNVQKTTMTFDRIYSSRTAMDAAVSNDGVYAGRYVLVEYNNALDPTLLPGVVQFDGMLYPPPPARLPSSWKDDDNDPTSPTSYLTKLNPLTVKADLTEDMAEGFIKPKTIVICSSDFNLGVVQNEQGDKSILPWGKKQYFEISDSDTTKMSYNLLYNYKDQKFQLDSSSSKESKTGCSYSEINYSAVSTDPDSADANYLLNFNLDVNNYNAARGYDSTVWQKTYASGKPIKFDYRYSKYKLSRICRIFKLTNEIFRNFQLRSDFCTGFGIFQGIVVLKGYTELFSHIRQTVPGQLREVIAAKL